MVERLKFVADCISGTGNIASLVHDEGRVCISADSSPILSQEDTIRFRDYLTTVIGDRQQPDDAAVERRARDTWTREGHAYHWMRVGTNLQEAYRQAARRALTAEAQTQPDPEAAVLALAKDLGWEAADDNWRNHYIKRARAKLTPTLPVPKTAEQIEAALHHLTMTAPVGEISNQQVALIHSWLSAAKGEAA